MRTTERLALRLAVAVALLVVASRVALAQHTDPAASAGLQNLTFAAHVDTVFTGPTGLEHASQVLQRCDAIVTDDQDVACNITFAQEGEIGTFGTAADGLDVITTADELNAVLNNTAAYVKVVTSIEFCDGVPGTFSGCALTNGASMVIVAGLDENATGEVIAHQFGHNKGLPDRTTPGNPLMGTAPGGDEVNQAECTAFHVGLTDNGPNVQQDFPPEITCPANATVECSAAGGTPKTDPQIVAFLGGAAADDGCEVAPTVTNDAPDSFPVGVTTVTFTATDSTSNTATCTATVTVQDTTPPVATCPANAQVECSATGGTPKTDPALVPFFAGASATDVCDPAPVLTNNAPDLFPLGSTDVLFTATDGSGNAGNCTASVAVADTTPPETSVALDSYSLWPPNHKLVTITAQVGLTDICDANPTFVLFSIESTESDNGNGDGNTSPDIVGADVGTPDTQFQLRAERSGPGSGRAYNIVYQGADASGNTSSATTCVAVPHDQGHGGDLCSGPLATKKKGKGNRH